MYDAAQCNLSSNLNTTVELMLHSIFSVMKNITHTGIKCLTCLKFKNTVNTAHTVVLP